MTRAAKHAEPLAPVEGILLQGGTMLLLFENAGALPASGRVATGDTLSPWQAGEWPAQGGGSVAIAVVAGLPQPGAMLVWEEGAARPLVAPARVDLAPDALVKLVRRAGLDPHGVFAFLLRHLFEGRPRTCEVARAHRAFARDFLAATAEPDGFVEIVARPECGGVFLQGWSLSLPEGPGRVTSVAEDLAMREVEVAVFDRTDLLAPARGCCLYAKDWSDDPASLSAIFFERDGRLARLDVVQPPLIQRDAALATQHVAEMLLRLSGPPETLRAFRRVCRPRYEGVDTLSGTDLPVAAAIDLLLQAPDGRLLASGWLLDPTRRLEMAILKSTEGPYAPIHDRWIRLPRPDLAAGYAADPRFANLLDARDAMHGFVVHVPDWEPGGDLYLELVLDVGVLFLPLRATPALAADRLAALLPALAPAEPEFDRIVSLHLAPFFAALPRRTAAGTGPAIPLGAAIEAPRVQALMPIDRLIDLQPVLGLLSGSADASDLDLTLIASRTVAREGLRRIEEAFEFYELSGRLVVLPDGLPVPARLDAGLETGSAPAVLAWHPSALPQREGWLAALLEESAEIGAPHLLAPALIYEDGSIFFAGEAPDPHEHRCARLGYARSWFEPGAPRTVAAAAAEIALVDRAALVGAGGFAGRLFSGRYAHLDLADRLRVNGVRSWCSGRVVFWKLEDRAEADIDPVQDVLAAVDRALLALSAPPRELSA